MSKTPYIHSVYDTVYEGLRVDVNNEPYADQERAITEAVANGFTEEQARAILPLVLRDLKSQNERMAQNNPGRPVRRWNVNDDGSGI